LILIDYPGFNLRISKWLKKHKTQAINSLLEKKIKVFYYISPQIWAWHTSRVHQIKRDIDKMFVILPFEKDFYKKYQYDVDFVGHPLLDAIQNFERDPDFFEKNKLDKHKKIIALLPGSRKQEISKLLPLMIETSHQFTDYQFVIAGAPSMSEAFYATFLQGSNLKIIYNQTYALLQNAHAALVTSGTATLETALFNVPEVVCYKGSPISYQIAKRLIDIKYISLVNLISDKKIVTELIQNDCSVENLCAELCLIVEGKNRQTMLNQYAELRTLLGEKGASEKTAKLMYEAIATH
jgi:lipid-A-disaccharide synthase